MLTNGLSILANPPISGEFDSADGLEAVQQELCLSWEGLCETVLLVWVSGDLCGEAEAALRRLLVGHRRAGRRRIGIDMSRVKRISTEVIESIADAASIHRAIGGALVVLAAESWLRSCFRACDAESVLAAEGTLDSQIREAAFSSDDGLPAPPTEQVAGLPALVQAEGRE